MAVTLTSLQNDYKTYLQAQNSKIDAFAPNTYWAYQAGAMAAFFLDLYLNLQLLQNSIYPQNSVGDQVDLWLYSRGLTARGGLTYGTVNCVLMTPIPATIAKGTIFTDENTSNQYQALQDFTINNDTTQFTLYATTAGPGIVEPIDAELANETTLIKVKSSTAGQAEESDQSCINRILQSIRIPAAGARQEDYFAYALAANTTLALPAITYAIIIPAFRTINTIKILGVFPLVGTAITEYQLNQGLLPATTFIGYSRQAGDEVVTAVNNYIQGQRLVGLSVSVGKCITHAVTRGASQLSIAVSLVAGYTLSTELTIESQDSDNNPITVTLTVAQLIKREARRAICNQNFGATNINNQNYITLDSIAYSLNIQLSAINGNLAQVLTNIQISGSNIEVPNFNESASAVYYTYDIDSYNNIVVSAT